MLRQILIAHHSGSTRKQIRSGIEANFSDAAVFEAEDAEQALEAADMLNLHLIFFAVPLAPDNLIEVYHQFQSKSQGMTIPFLLLTDGEPHPQYQALLDAGAAGCLAMPCPPEELNEAISNAFNPLAVRSSHRYSIPNAEVHLQQAVDSFFGQVINISDGGMLCQLNDPANFVWSTLAFLTLSFKVSGQQITVPDISAIAVHLNVLKSRPDHSPAQVRVAFRFVDMTAKARQQLRDIFSVLEVSLGSPAGE